jgi:hypothetical protein
MNLTENTGEEQGKPINYMLPVVYCEENKMHVLEPKKVPCLPDFEPRKLQRCRTPYAWVPPMPCPR